MAKNSNKSGQTPSANTGGGLPNSDSIERILAPPGIRRTVDVSVDYNLDDGEACPQHSGGSPNYSDVRSYQHKGI